MKKGFLILSLLLALLPTLWAQPLAIDALPKQWIAGERPTAWAHDEVYVLEFWATWCGPCRKAIPHMEAVWQKVKGQGIHIIGVNSAEKLPAQRIQHFLSTQPTPPTYAIALDREEKLYQTLDITAFPTTLIVMNGEIVWRGLPMDLSVEQLLRLRKVDTQAAPAEAPSPPNAPSEAPTLHPMVALEKAADAAAAKGDWEQAIALQQQALLAHPIQQQLKQKRLPTYSPKPTAYLTTQAPRTLWVEALQRDLPVDDQALTVVSLWSYPWWIETFTQDTLHLTPGEREAHTFTAPYRSITLVDQRFHDKTQALLQRLGTVKTDIHFTPKPDTTLFNVNDHYKYPFVLVYLGNECLYRGALEALPAPLKGPLQTLKGYRQALAEEETKAAQSKDLLQALRTGKIDPETALQTKLAPGYAAMAIPYLFGDVHKTGDTATACQRLETLIATYADAPGVLETLLKLVDAWFDLSLASLAQQETIARLLAEQNPKVAPQYAVEYYLLAARCAQQQNAPDRAQAYLEKALEQTPQARRLHAFQHHRLPLSS